jgi:hypothetical protein
MKKSRYTDLKQAESGPAITDLCRKHGMRSATFYNCLQLPLQENICRRKA